MGFLSVAETAAKWKIAERTVRNYCAGGRIPGAFMTGKTWNVPDYARRPERVNTHTAEPRGLLDILRVEQAAGISGGIYHKIQIELTYNSNHIEGNSLTHGQTRYIYETNTVAATDGRAVNADDIIETANHFRCVDLVIEAANRRLSEKFIKELHFTLVNGTSASRKNLFAVGDYKRLPNEVGGMETTQPEDVADAMKSLFDSYNSQECITLADIIDFHARFESIHPFQDGNGRVGRLVMFKECLKNDIVPFIITDAMKSYYYRGLREWRHEKGFLSDTCLAAQDSFKKYLDYFRIKH